LVNAGEAVADELLGDEAQGVAVAHPGLLGGVGRPLADLVEHAAGTVGDPAIELAVVVAIVGAGLRIRRIPGDAGEFERLAVVKRGVAAAVADLDRVIARHLIEVVDIELAVVLHLGVVEEISLDPKSGRRLAGFGAQLVDDAGDSHELDLIRIPDQHLV
jgi:hypothetical protein